MIFYGFLLQNLSKILTSAHDFLGILLQNILKILTLPHLMIFDDFPEVFCSKISQKILTSAHDFW